VLITTQKRATINTIASVINDLVITGDLLYTQRVGGSRPSSPTNFSIKIRHLRVFFFDLNKVGQKLGRSWDYATVLLGFRASIESLSSTFKVGVP
jgi:hypothetical protein